MKNILHHLLAIIVTFWALNTNAQNTDYDILAKEITQNCNTNYERAREIYRWICANISYDFDKVANNADKCLELRRGTSFGYSQLYARLAQAVGMQPIVVAGKAKSSTIPSGHCWIYVRCDDKDLLIDPMWGSGSISNGTFVRANEDYMWFDVAPEWMIFTHFPQEKRYQFLKKKISEENFLELPPLHPYIEKFGFDAAEMLSLACNKKSKGMPNIYPPIAGFDIKVEELPIQEKLEVGNAYHFSFKKKSHHKLMLICKNEFVSEDMWEYKDSIYSLTYRPFNADKMSISYESDNTGTYTTFIEYQIAAPTRAQLDTLEKHRPLATEEVRNFTSINIEALERMKINGEQLLKAIRNKEITSMPHFFSDCKFEIIEIPLSGTLEVGKSYRFRIRPHEKGHSWIITHGRKRFRRWTIDEQSGEQEITVLTTEQGQLELSVIYSHDKGFYHTCIVYEVK